MSFLIAFDMDIVVHYANSSVIALSVIARVTIRFIFLRLVLILQYYVLKNVLSLYVRNALFVTWVLIFSYFL